MKHRCLLTRISQRRPYVLPRAPPKRPRFLRPYTSSTSSYTAIHSSPLETSKKRLALFNVLQTLRQTNHHDEARLQLALRGLEQIDAPVRIAIVGLRENSNPGRLLRVLLADPLAGETPEWEHVLSTFFPSNTGRSLLLQYGETANVRTPPNSPLTLISLPHRLLDRREILVTNLDGIAGNTNVLAPTLTIGPNNPVISMPVHHSVILVEDLEELLTGAAEGFEGQEGEVQVAIDVEGEVLKAIEGDTATSSRSKRFVSISLAETAIEKLRQSTDNATAYEELWFQSRVPNLIDMLSSTQSKSSQDTLNKPLLSLVKSILRTTIPPLQTRPAIGTPSFDHSQTDSLTDVLASWSRAAHGELRQELDRGFTTAPYTRLSWWKLFWTTDDVRMICECVINRRFLTQAERQSWWLAGRVAGSGHQLPTIDAFPPSVAYETSSSISSITNEPAATSATSTLAFESSESQILQWQLQPQPVTEPISSSTPSPLPPADLLTTHANHITASRQHIIQTLINPLHRTAQSSLLTFLSTTTLSTAVSVVLYTLNFTAYSSFSILAFGMVFASLRMQRQWTAAKEAWEAQVREEGRQAVNGVERWVGTSLKMHVGESESTEQQVFREAQEERERVMQVVTRGRELVEEFEKDAGTMPPIP